MAQEAADSEEDETPAKKPPPKKAKKILTVDVESEDPREDVVALIQRVSNQMSDRVTAGMNQAARDNQDAKSVRADPGTSPWLPGGADPSVLASGPSRVARGEREVLSTVSARLGVVRATLSTRVKSLSNTSKRFVYRAVFRRALAIFSSRFAAARISQLAFAPPPRGRSLFCANTTS